ncbi:hypothetical protein [Nocardia fluminea]|uniref:hypothetical protein n=1 Tax=Nocardia fluminea TaxID=134984 RepID=UPI00378BC2D8
MIAPTCAALLMVTAIVVSLHRGWVMTELWLLALPVLGVGWLTVIALFAIAIARVRKPAQRWPLVSTAAMAVVGIGAPALFVVCPEVGAWTRFWLERPAFSAVAALDIPDDEDYYGNPLPRHLCFVSANCKVVTINTVGGPPARFVPDYLGIPDGAVGYAHFTEAPGPEPYNGFGDPICPTMELGGGWWWLGGCP